MNPHPYLRAYMAGLFAPSLGLLVALTIFIVTRVVLQVAIPLERVLIFPMALVPNLFGLWNVFYVWLRPAPASAHRPPRRAAAGAHDSSGSCRCYLRRVPDDRRARRYLVRCDQHPIFVAYSVVPGRGCDLLPYLEVHRGIL